MKNMYLKEEKGKFYVFNEKGLKLSKGFENTVDAIKHKTELIKGKVNL